MGKRCKRRKEPKFLHEVWKRRNFKKARMLEKKCCISVARGKGNKKGASISKKGKTEKDGLIFF